MPSINNNDICYHYQRNNNDNKKTHIFIPQGKQMILWFVKYNKQNYSILLEYILFLLSYSVYISFFMSTGYIVKFAQNSLIKI